MGTRDITYIDPATGLPTKIQAEDADLFGTGNAAARPASGDFTGDLWLLVEGSRYILQRWSGATWESLTMFPSVGGSTDEAIARFDGTTGQLQNSLASIDDSGNIDNSEGEFNGIRHYDASATDPVSPAPADGDRYYNNVLNMEMRYDGSRSKWLSVQSDTIEFGRNNNVGTGAFFRGPDRRAYAADEGRRADWDGTVVAMQMTRTDATSVTIEATANGSTIASVGPSGAATEFGDNALDGDFSQNEILGFRNSSGSAGNVNNLVGWATIRWRAT